jgi:transcriptional regulator with XRE-family HTH domain
MTTKPTETNAPSANGTDDPTAVVGRRMRELRAGRRLRLRDIADRSGLSESFLSQLERGRANASVASLLKIAEALDITVADLFDNQAGRPRVLHKFERPAIAFGIAARKYMLTPRPLENLEVFTATIGPGGSSGEEAYSHGDSEELFLVIGGQLDLELGDTVHTMVAGDSICYRSSVKHRVFNRSSDEAEAMWIISPPSY